MNYDTVSFMVPTMRRGLLRLALILMIVWNLWVLWFSFKSIGENRSLTLSIALGSETDCMKVRPFRDCHAEYETSVGGYSEWAEFRRQFTPSNVAIIEFIPPLTIGLLWGALWGLGAAVAWMLRGFGIETRKPGESLTVMERLRGAGRWFVTPKNMLALSVGIVALAVSYYFLVSLPASNRDRLQFEKDTAAATKAERDSKEEAAAQAAQEQELSLQRCSDEADTAYWSYVKLNGKEIPDKPVTYSAPMFVWNAAEKQKTDALAECHRQYDPKK